MKFTPGPAKARPVVPPLKTDTPHEIRAAVPPLKIGAASEEKPSERVQAFYKQLSDAAGHRLSAVGQFGSRLSGADRPFVIFCYDTLPLIGAASAPYLGR